MSKRNSRSARSRALAQNFLIDDQVVDSLVQKLNPGPKSLVLDLGAGRGALTEPLARAAGRVVAVERDPRLVDHLRRKSPGWGGIEVRSADILRVPFPAEEHMVISNAPYNIGTALIRRVLSEAHGLARGVFVLQAETARRLAGCPRSGLFAATWAPWFRFELGQTIGPESFRPKPSVRSAVLTVEPRPQPLLSPAAHREYRAFLDQMFQDGGVTLRNRMKGMAGAKSANRITSELGLRGGATPSEAAPEDYAKIFAAIVTREGG